MFFKDRLEAGQKLIPLLEQYKNNPDAIILGLPRGGVIPAAEISKTLSLPLDIIVPRKIGAPGNPEFAIGAITEDGEAVFNEGVGTIYKIDEKYTKQEIEKQKKEAQRRLETYRGDRPPLSLTGKIAILVDDGVATGATMRAAIKSAEQKGAKKIIVAIPVIAKDSLQAIQGECDEIIYLDAPIAFGAVGAFYETFPQTEDQEVIEILKKNQMIFQ
ncbi:MAG: phosphoribosyltransferase [Candidatus Moranbacteria bacterium]|nr:phosphoribosyltransferase [Candidatus Moranbacteria bacterium]